jgi:signal transduction histidine kinase
VYLTEVLLTFVWVVWYGVVIHVWLRHTWPGWVLHVAQGGIAVLLGLHVVPHANTAMSGAAQGGPIPIMLAFAFISTLILSIPLTFRHKRLLRPLTTIEIGGLVIISILLSNSGMLMAPLQRLNTLMGLAVAIGLIFTGFLTRQVFVTHADHTWKKIIMITASGIGVIGILSSLSWILVKLNQSGLRPWLDVLAWCLLAGGVVLAVGVGLRYLVLGPLLRFLFPRPVRSFLLSDMPQEETGSTFESVREAALQFPANLDLETILGQILRKALNLTESDDAHIFLFDGKKLTFGGAMWSGDFQHKPFSEPRPDGITYTVARSGEPIIVSDVNQHQLFQDDPWGGAIISLPLTFQGEINGVMNVAFERPHSFQPEEVQLLEVLCDQAAIALTNTYLYQQTERRLAEMTALREVMQVVNRRLEMKPLLDAIITQVREVLGYPLVEILLVEEGDLVLVARVGDESYKMHRHSLIEGVTGRVARTNEPVFVQDVEEDPDYIKVVDSTVSEIAVPLSTGGLVIGVLNVESPESDALTYEDLRLLTLLGDQIAIALENAGLYERLTQHADELEETVQERTAALEQALGLAREADQVRTRFVSDVSHELRTPLSNIRLYLSLLDREHDEKFLSYLDTLNRETDRLIALIEDLLAISRLDAGTAVPKPAPVDLNQVAKHLATDRQRLFAERELGLEVSVEADMPPVLADESMLTQAIATLLTNAMNYTPNGGRVWIETASQPPEWVTLTVRDTGLGITRNEISQIFERFFRGTASRMVGNPGTGLGLAICQEIIARQDGKLTVESTVGEGSTFTIWLPMYSRSN